MILNVYVKHYLNVKFCISVLKVMETKPMCFFNNSRKSQCQEAEGQELFCILQAESNTELTKFCFVSSNNVLLALHDDSICFNSHRL